MPSSQGPAKAATVPIDCAARRMPPMMFGFLMRSPGRKFDLSCLPARQFRRHRRIAPSVPRECPNGVGRPSKIGYRFHADHVGCVQGPEMTYCCGILVREGLVMIADTRTNAGLDNVSTFRKLHVFAKP